MELLPVGSVPTGSAATPLVALQRRDSRASSVPTEKAADPVPPEEPAANKPRGSGDLQQDRDYCVREHQKALRAVAQPRRSLGDSDDPDLVFRKLEDLRERIARGEAPSPGARATHLDVFTATMCHAVERLQEYHEWFKRQTAPIHADNKGKVCFKNSKRFKWWRASAARILKKMFSGKVSLAVLRQKSWKYNQKTTRCSFRPH